MTRLLTPSPHGVQVEEKAGELLVRTYRTSRGFGPVRMVLLGISIVGLGLWLIGSPARHDNGSPSSGIGVIMDLGIFMIAAGGLGIWFFVELVLLILPRRVLDDGQLVLGHARLELDGVSRPLAAIAEVKVDIDASGSFVVIAPFGRFAAGSRLSPDAARWLANLIESRRG